MLQEFLYNYKVNLTARINEIENDNIKNIIELLESTHGKGRIFVIGNGGSASTASHMVNDLGIGLKRRGIRNFDIESLADNNAVITAISNDMGYENSFYLQLKNKIKKEDLLIAISCSGNSPNIIKAVEYANLLNVSVIGLTGFDGGKLKSLVDESFHIETKKGEYGIVEDMHLIFNHIIYSYFLNKV